jgi:hypothetical protein
LPVGNNGSKEQICHFGSHSDMSASLFASLYTCGNRKNVTSVFKSPLLKLDLHIDVQQFEYTTVTSIREEDYQELSNKIKQVNNQLNMRMDALIERFEELNKKILVVTNKVNNKTNLHL